MRSCACRDRKANAKFRSRISIALPGNTPNVDTNLQADELITAVDLPAMPFAVRSHYLKMRDRASYAFALVSVAAVLDLGAEGTITSARIALGGVAHKPWRALEAEKQLIGKKAMRQHRSRAAAEASSRAAKGYAAQRIQNRTGETQHRARAHHGRAMALNI